MNTTTTFPPNGKTIGFIGLGLMGKPMARHLKQAGAHVIIHNRSQEVVQELEQEGFTSASSPAKVAEAVQDGYIILMLTNTYAVEEVVAGEQGVFTRLQPSATIIDMGSTWVRETQRWQQTAAEKEADWIDAPVSGGQQGARDATLTIMAGGNKSTFDQVKPILDILGGSVTYMGGSGTGQITKLANQLIVANTIASVSEAFLLCESTGVDVTAARQALLNGFAGSKILDMHGLRMIEGNYEPGGRATSQLKDLVEVRRVAQDHQLDLPMLMTNIPLWEKMIDAGLGNLDHSGLYRYYQQQHPKQS
uniref:NAD(P)-dependent oxidoreductase n=1 Tax=Roseihalotalea indica TaxID=2867963 RepID=A0AA49GME8_9BACT|nr:NAD(P)-dependent oxidoreductase [Tunicatimonas sp. TK19036]